MIWCDPLKINVVYQALKCLSIILLSFWMAEAGKIPNRNSNYAEFHIFNRIIL